MGEFGKATNPGQGNYAGSNPVKMISFATIAQLAERQPSKLDVAGSWPVRRSLAPKALLAMYRSRKAASLVRILVGAPMPE